MTFEEFMRVEEEREQQRREQRLAKERRIEAEKEKKKNVIDVKELAKQKKAAQRALRERIERDAATRYAEGNKKKYDLAQPPGGPVEWLVFDRKTGELYGTATVLRAHQAFCEVNPKRVLEDGTIYMLGFNEVRCVQREDWQAAEEQMRQRRSSNGKAR